MLTVEELRKCVYDDMPDNVEINPDTLKKMDEIKDENKILWNTKIKESYAGINYDKIDNIYFWCDEYGEGDTQVSRLTDINMSDYCICEKERGFLVGDKFKISEIQIYVSDDETKMIYDVEATLVMKYEADVDVASHYYTLLINGEHKLMVQRYYLEYLERLN